MPQRKKKHFKITALMLTLLVLGIGLVSWMGMARLVRGQFLSLREKEFVEAAEAELQIGMAALEASRTELEKLATAARADLAESDGAVAADIDRLVSVYEAMKPKEAAQLFEAMPPSFAAGFLARMRAEQAAEERHRFPRKRQLPADAERQRANFRGNVHVVTDDGFELTSESLDYLGRRDAQQAAQAATASHCRSGRAPAGGRRPGGPHRAHPQHRRFAGHGLAWRVTDDHVYLYSPARVSQGGRNVRTASSPNPWPARYGGLSFLFRGAGG